MNIDSNIPYIIQEELQKELPGKTSHLKLIPPYRPIDIPQKKDNIKHSGVLLLLVPEKKGWQLCFIERNRKLKHHPGQISFPGGRFETSDKTTMNTAIRETFEEIGISQNQYNILGALSPIYVSVSNFIIFPYIAQLHEKTSFTICANEVERVLLLPLASFLNGSLVECTVKTIYGPQVVPCYQIENLSIWGATAMILTELIDILKLHQQKL